MPKNIIEKIWDAHVVEQKKGHPAIMAIDLQLIHEVTSPQAFQGLRDKGLKVKYPGKHLATLDHSIPTRKDRENIYDEVAKKQVETLRNNAKEFGVPIYDFGSGHQGVVHIISPELGATQPGMTICCGDSHTATHGAFGALAFGVGTTEVGMVMATGCLLQQKPKTMKVDLKGKLREGVYSKDVILKLIQTIGVGGANGYIIEYTGDAIKKMSMEARMTICNMSIECGGRGGLISPDQKTFDYIKGSVENERVVFLHARGANSELHFYKNVGERLENIGYEVIYVDVPNSTDPTSQNWIDELGKIKPILDENTTIVTHSISSLALARFLTDNDIKLKAWHSVGGSFELIARENFSEDALQHRKSFDPQTLDYAKISNSFEKIYIHHSKDDDKVPFESAQKYVENLPNAKLLEYQNKRHFLANRQDPDFKIPFEELYEAIVSDSQIIPRPYTPKPKDWEKATEHWKTFVSDEDSLYDKEIVIDCDNLEPMITWGTNPAEGVEVSGSVPMIKDLPEEGQNNAKNSLKYVGLDEGQQMENLPIDWAFLGSCTNGRLEDLRIAARLLDGKKVADNVTFYVVPGSEEVKERAEKEGLDKIFIEAGADWRMPGCSSCLAMNDDKIPAGKRTVSTSNRNFMNRQGPGAITHLASPATVTLSAIQGKVIDARKYFDN